MNFEERKNYLINKYEKLATQKNAVDFINTLCSIYCDIMTYLPNFRIICIKYT